MKPSWRRLIVANAAACALLCQPLTPFVATAVPVQITDTSTSATVDFDNEVTSGGTLTLSGSGWTNAAGDAGSVVAIKLRGESDDFSRTSGILKNPRSQAEDKTLWALVNAEQDGSWKQTIDLPEELQPGQKISVVVTSGLAGEDDVQRSVLSEPLVVDGKAYEGTNEATVTCTTDVKPEISVAKEANADGTLHVTGKGWCNEISGGAKLAFKLDDGRYSRLDDSIHSNRTIWWIQQADEETGEIDFDLQLPDGTAEGPNGSQPAFPDGQHVLRVLAGSLQEGDPHRSFPLPKKPDPMTFVVGNYKPTGVPGPKGSAELGDDARNGMTVEETADKYKVTLENGEEGDWVWPSLYSGSSRRLSWGAQWFQLDSQGKVELDIPKNDLPSGDTVKLVLQSGNKDSYGEVVGWAPVKGAPKPTKTTKPIKPSTPPAQNDRQTPAMSPEDAEAGRPGPLPNANANNGNGSNKPVFRVTGPTSAERVAPRRTNRSGRGSGARLVGQGSSSRSGSGSSGSGKSSSKKKDSKEQKKPTNTPKAPAASIDGLTKSNMGKIKGKLSKNGMLKITVEKAKAEDWVYVYSYTPERDKLGWMQLNKKKSATIDVSGLADGEHKFAVLDKDGKMLGWIGIRLGNATESSEAQAADEANATGESQSLLNAGDWWIIGGASLFVLFLVSTLGVLHKRRNRADAGLH